MNPKLISQIAMRILLHQEYVYFYNFLQFHHLSEYSTNVYFKKFLGGFRESCLADVAGCDLYIGIIGRR